MNNRTANVFIAAAVASLVAGSAVAQTTAFSKADAADDRVEDLQEDIAEDFERDVDAFGNEGRKLGFNGSISARATATSGNTDNTDIGIGARMGYFDGLNGHEVTLSYTYGETDDVSNQDSLLAAYDYTRELGTNIYAFGKAQVAYDDFASYERDAFVGAGVGYRIYNTNDIQWSVQAGPGYRYAETATGDELEEAALSVSSNYLHRLNETVFVTNDTDVLASESDTFVTNELGMNVAMSDTLALRTSLLTEYHTDPQPGFDDTDNTLGASVVYTFN